MKLRQKQDWYRNRYPGEYSIQDAFEIECGGLSGGTDTIVGMILERLYDKGAFSNEEILAMLNARNASWEEVPAPEPVYMETMVPGSDG